MAGCVAVGYVAGMLLNLLCLKHVVEYALFSHMW